MHCRAALAAVASATAAGAPRKRWRAGSLAFPCRRGAVALHVQWGSCRPLPLTSCSSPPAPCTLLLACLSARRFPPPQLGTNKRAKAKREELKNLYAAQRAAAAKAQ